MSWTEKEIIIDKRTLCDLECILDGSFHPLNKFMGKEDWESAIEKMTLKSGEFFPLPINLAIERDIFNEKNLGTGSEIVLSNQMHLPIVRMKIEEYYEPDIYKECELAYGTKDELHPYVKYKMMQKNCYYVSGKMELMNKIPHYNFKELRNTPSDLKKYFKENKWDMIVGFQTRNPMHKSHYNLTKYALDNIKTGDNKPKLLIHPVVGVTQDDDINYITRVKCYKEIIKHYPEGDIKLSILQLSMRMAGPKEACFHALVRKNYGCTHFIVGRDHAGPSVKNREGRSFYQEYDAQKLLKEYAEKIGIKPVYSNNIIYNSKDNKYYEESKFPVDGIKCFLSGTELRRMIKEDIDVPEWFSFEEVIKILKGDIKKRGICFYFIGLSCSGKTTHACELKKMIEEYYPNREVTLLDGDEVRNNLSQGLGFTDNDRSINVRRIGWVASEIVKHNGIVICSNIAPFEKDREYNREKIMNRGGKYVEIFVDTDISICESRDVKGLYRRAREGEIKNFTGINSVFETPKNCEITIKNNNLNIKQLLKLI